ncbi:hypothetical protein I4U23_014765 [Adineta vaga]|nr:hypothetical protein I4U23_014765 [Adineta vaga]
MLEKQQINSSIHDFSSESNKKANVAKGKIQISIAIGLVLTCITIALQCIAFFTPHWKEISPNTNSLYVDGVDALIRTEVLHYFNTIHRSTRHSYGLFQRCEYILSNSSTLDYQVNLVNIFRIHEGRKCSKNYLPSYNDEQFNECHSLSYYQFCAKANAKNFDINNDYLRATFDLSPIQKDSDSPFSCDCHYPPYVTLCRILGSLGLILLFLTSLFYIFILVCTNSHYRVKIRCFGFLTTISAVFFLMLNLIIIFQHMEYESIDYLVAIKKHYRSNQIYKLSQDTNTAIDRFLASIQIRMGYSAIIGWIAFILSIVDAILLLTTCRLPNKDNDNEREVRTTLMSSSSSSQNEDHQLLSQFTGIPYDVQSPPLLTSNDITLHNEKQQKLRILVEDEV